MKYSHSNELEERYFALDIESLKQHDEGFKTAYDDGSDYELTIKLIDPFCFVQGNASVSNSISAL